MNKFKAFLEICKEEGAVGAWVCLLTTVFLFVGAALCPPRFIVDSSILVAGGIFFGFATLWKLPAIVNSIKEGKSLKLSHGDTTLEVNSEKTEENNE